MATKKGTGEAKVKKVKYVKPGGLPKGTSPSDLGQKLRSEKNKRLNIEKDVRMKAKHAAKKLRRKSRKVN